MSETLVLEKWSSGNLIARKKNKKTGVITKLTLPNDWDKLDSKSQDTIQHYPDLNDICFLTRAIMNPRSIIPFLKECNQEISKMYGSSWSPYMKYYFDIACNETEVVDDDMIRIVFLHFFVHNPVIRREVLKYSDQSMGKPFYAFALYYLRNLFITVLDENTINEVLNSMFIVLAEFLMYKSSGLMQDLLQNSLYVDGMDVNIFDDCFPMPETNETKREKTKKWDSSQEDIYRSLDSFRKRKYSVFKGMNLDEFITFRNDISMIRPKTLATKSKKGIEIIARTDMNLGKMLRLSQEE